MVGEEVCSRHSGSTYKGTEVCWEVRRVQLRRRAWLRGKLEKLRQELENHCFFFFSLPMQDYDLGLEPGFRKMASRDPLGTFGGRSQLGGRAPVAWIHHSPPISEKELLSSTRKGAISQYSFVFFRLYYRTVYIHFI